MITKKQCDLMAASVQSQPYSEVVALVDTVREFAELLTTAANDFVPQNGNEVQWVRDVRSKLAVYCGESGAVVLTDVANYRENVLAELDKIIEHAKASMGQGCWVTVEHHWREPRVKRFRLGVTADDDKVCIGSTIKIMWGAE